MLVINVVALMAIAFICGYAVAKGRLIVIERKVELSAEEKEKIDKMQREQDDAIQKYNEMVNSMTRYVNTEVI